MVGPLLPPLLQETIADAIQISNAPDANAKVSFRRDFLVQIAATIRTKSEITHAASIGKLGPLRGPAGIISDGAVVVIVRLEVVEPEPGVTLAGEKVHAASDGRPEQARDTAFVNAPNCWPTEIV